MYDLLIRNGRVIDGSGAAAKVADVAVQGGTIAEVGQNLGSARREIDAAGRLVLPGWVDIHTHYDGQATWDAELAPSSWHGVTTAVFGNCGVGFAPVRRGSEPYLINLMEGVEDIPGTVLAQGIDFSWESFPEYLDTLERTPRTMDIGAQVPHAALRFYVMGDEGADHRKIPDAAQIEAMGRLLEEALAAGALGFSTSRTTKHRAADGSPTPSLSAGEPELHGLARAMRRAGSGVLQVNSDFGTGEFEVLRAAAEVAGRPLSVLLLQSDYAPDLWRETLEQIHAARRDGIQANGQVGSRPIGLVMGLDTSMHPFASRAAWREVADLPPAERVARLRADADLRERLVSEPPANDDMITQMIEAALPKTYRLTEPVDYEQDPANALVAQAQRRGCRPLELALEWMLDSDGKGMLLFPFENYSAGSLDVVREMLLDDATVCGLADGGAHVGLICDASSTTTLLTHWGRDRKRGPGLPLEHLVKKQTRDTALAYGLADRGLIAPGLRADLNIVDFDRLRVRLPEVVHDLPAGGKRVLQRAEGYDHTFVAGVETFRDGAPTGERPGRLLRGSATG
ncbi:MAG: amidohydrolase family protein [Pseudomonadota bacterium]|nr:amidohydrolase family protein [Pseudomonadota bacterium]